MTRSIELVCALGLAVVCGANVPASHAFSVSKFFAGEEIRYAKWGGEHREFVPGGVVTWSFMPPGTVGSSFCEGACPATAVAAINIERSPAGGFDLVPLSELEAIVRRSLAKWAAVANIEFVGPVNDSGLPVNDSGATGGEAGDIRIGVFAFSSGGGAVGQAPPIPGGGTGQGDVVFDANSFYQFAALYGSGPNFRFGNNGVNA